MVAILRFPPNERSTAVLFFTASPSLLLPTVSYDLRHHHSCCSHSCSSIIVVFVSSSSHFLRSFADVDMNPAYFGTSPVIVVRIIVKYQFYNLLSLEHSRLVTKSKLYVLVSHAVHYLWLHFLSSIQPLL